MKNAKIILKINEIEKKRQYNGSDGIIVVNIEDMLADNLDGLLNKCVEHDGEWTKWNSIEFHQEDGRYLIKLTNIEQENIEVGYYTKEDVERILCYSLLITNICYDNNYISFFSLDDDAFEERNISIQYRKLNHAVIAGIRRCLWEHMI